MVLKNLLGWEFDREETVPVGQRYSGITSEILNGVTTTIKDIQEEFLQLVYEETILVVHSLENDLLALKIFHNLVIDIALLYKHPHGKSFKTDFFPERFRIQEMDMIVLKMQELQWNWHY